MHVCLYGGSLYGVSVGLSRFHEGLLGALHSSSARSLWVYGGSLSGVSVGLTHSSWGPCAGSVCVYGGSLSGVSVGLSRSLWGYWGPCAGSLWVYGGSLSGVCVGLTHSSRAPPSLSSLHLTAGEGRDSPGQVSCCSVSVPSVSCLQTGTLVPAPPTQRSPLGASEKTWQQPGSGSKLCAPLS